MYPIGFPRVTVCQFVTVKEAVWVFSGPWKLEMSIVLSTIIYFAVRSVGRLKGWLPIAFSELLWVAELHLRWRKRARKFWKQDSWGLTSHLPAQRMQTDSVWGVIKELMLASAARRQIEALICLTCLSVGQMIDTFYSVLIILINFEFLVVVLDLRVTWIFNVDISSLVHMYTHSLHIGEIDTIL